MIKPMNEVLAESLYNRGINIAEWPADEAATYRDNGGFHTGKAAVADLRFRKAADALTAEGYGNVAEAQALALEDFANFILTPAEPGLDRYTIQELVLEARHRAEALRAPADMEVAS